MEQQRLVRDYPIMPYQCAAYILVLKAKHLKYFAISYNNLKIKMKITPLFVSLTSFIHLYIPSNVFFFLKTILTNIILLLKLYEKYIQSFLRDIHKIKYLSCRFDIRFVLLDNFKWIQEISNSSYLGSSS